MKAVDRGSLARNLLTRPGDTYDADAVSKTVDDLTMELAKSGQPFASVFARTERVPPPNASAGAGNGASILPVALGGGARSGPSISFTRSTKANASTWSVSRSTATPKRTMTLSAASSILAKATPTIARWSIAPSGA